MPVESPHRYVFFYGQWIMGNADKKDNTEQYPWVPMAKNISKILPKDGRPYTEVEAVYCLQLDHNNGNQVSISGYSKLWGWSRRHVNKLFNRLSIEIKYPMDTLKTQKQHGQITSKITEKKRTDQRTENGQINFIDFNKLASRTETGQISGHYLREIRE